MDWDSPRKKRKLCHDHHDDQQDDEDNDEIKIEKFFSLIRSIREARDRLINGSDTLKQQLEMDNISKKKKRKLEQEVAVWKPCFQLEDFSAETTHQQQPKNPRNEATLQQVGDTSQRNQVPEKEKEESRNKEDLDLTLSL